MTLIIKTTGWDDYIGPEGAFIKALIMGAPGAGKTRSASFWPRPIYADCEQGRMSIADRAIPYAEIRSAEQMDQLLDVLKQECKKGGAQRKYDTFVLDTIDSYQRTLIAERLESEGKEAMSGWQDWGYLDGKMTQLVEKMLNLPMNIVVNLHVKETVEKVEGEEDSRTVMLPKLKGDFKDQIAAEFDLVGFMGTSWQAVNGERALVRGIRWDPDPKYPILKDRSGRLPKYTTIDFTPADFSRIYNRIVDDEMEKLPEVTVVAEIESSPPAAEPADDVTGGPVATVKDFPRRKSDLQPEPEVPEQQVVIEVPAADVDVVAADVEEPELATDVPSEPEQPSEEPTESPKTDQMKVESTPPPADDNSEVLHCGDQPGRYEGRTGKGKGCGKPLEGISRDRLNIMLIKTNQVLCEECFTDWKNAN